MRTNSEPLPRAGEPTAEEVLEQLRCTLASPSFQGSRRSQQFLAYVTEKTLAGEETAVKEKTIAVEVFGRDPRLDLPEDTIVRVSAREVRKRLAQYYVTEEGAAAPIRIELLSGSYAPDFRYQTASSEASVSPIVETHEIALADSPAGSSKGRWFAVAAGVAGAAALLIWAYFGLRDRGPFEKFWEPAFHSSGPVLVAVANPLVYHPSARASKLSEQGQPKSDSPAPRPLAVPPNLLDGSDIVPVFNQYVGVGDMVAATEAAAMLARHGQSTRVRLSSGVEFADLRGAPALLIGAVTNRWTMELQKNWRFQFGRQVGVRNMIADTQSAKEWSLPTRPDGSAPEDYVLICRLPNSLTGGLLVVTAGMRQFGTEAGGRLLTDAAQLDRILSKLPSGWESKNLQIVLHLRVIGNAPAQPEVVAWHLW